MGLEFRKQDNNYKDLINFNVANVLRLDENIYLPEKTKLNNKRSDIFGNLNYNLNNYLDLGYFFSYDKDLKYSNLEGLNLDLSLNNFLQIFIIMQKIMIWVIRRQYEIKVTF